MTLFLRIGCYVLLAAAIFCVVTLVASVPVPPAPRLGHRGTERRKGLTSNSLFATAEPMLRFVAGLVSLLLAPVVFIALGLSAYRAASQDDASTYEGPAPALFDERQVGPCPERESSITEHRARDHERAALAKQERSAFDATDGVDAVFPFREAQACFQLAGKADDASRVANELSQWSGRLNERYATLRLQLKVALDKQRHADALAAVRELQALLAHQEEGPYRQWLGQLSRTLEQKLAQPRS